MRNRSRLDLICVPEGMDTIFAHDAWPEMQANWVRTGLLDAAGRPTDKMVTGGGRGIAVDLPTTRVVYGNQLGGVRVRCTACGTGLAREFARSIEQVRESGVPSVRCTDCGKLLPLEALDIRPPLRLGRSALILQDVDGSQLTAQGRRAIEAWLGTFSVVLRRVS
jgi:DNA-directed RNA polymerase subunit N (RpoN/RPB10)